MGDAEWVIDGEKGFLDEERRMRGTKPAGEVWAAVRKDTIELDDTGG